MKLQSGVNRLDRDAEQAVPPAFTLDEQTIRTSRVRQFRDLDDQRLALGVPVVTLCRAAQLTPRAWRMWDDGERVPSFDALCRVRRALAAIRRDLDVV